MQEYEGFRVESCKNVRLSECKKHTGKVKWKLVVYGDVCRYRL